MTTSLPTPRVFAITLAILAACTLASCGAEQRVLARVGTHTITAEEFLDVARASRAQYAMLPDSAKRLLLEDMIRRELMLCEAEAQGLAQDSAIHSIRRGAEDDLVLGVLSDQLAPRTVPVSDAEVAKFYDWRKTEHHVEAIHVTTPQMTAEIMQRLASGEPFNILAMRYNLSGAVPPNGDLGFVPGGAVPEPLDTHIRESKIGEVFGPIRVGPTASFFGRVIERRTADIPPRDLVGDQLIEALRQRKHRAQVQRAIDGLRTGRRMRLEPGGAQILFARAAGMPETLGEPQRPDDQVVLARYVSVRGDTVYTIADANREMQTVAEGPDFSSIPSIERWIETHVLRRILIEEARRRHIHEEPLTSRRIEDRVNGMLLQTIYDREVSARVMVSDEELREEYLQRSAGQAAPPPPFEQMPIDLREQLRSMTMELKRDRLLEQFTDALRRKYPVTVDEALLRRLQWPQPTMDLPQQG